MKTKNPKNLVKRYENLCEDCKNIRSKLGE